MRPQLAKAVDWTIATVDAADNCHYNYTVIKLAMMLLLEAATIQAQAGSSEVFEVATVKPTDPPSRFPVFVGVRMDSGHGTFTCDFCNMESMLEYAYHVKAYQVSGLPWFNRDMFRIQARMRPGATEHEARGMMQRLLEERFQLKLNRTEESVVVFDMTAGPRGPRLTASDAETPASLSFGNGYLRAHKTSMTGLATRLSSALGVPVLNKTAIAGNFDIEIGCEHSGDGGLLTRSEARFYAGVVSSANKAPIEN